MEDEIARRPMVVMSYGMGVDSTAILLRWLTDPSSRDFDLGDLVVLTAHTGDEFDETMRDVEEVVLAEMRRHCVRFVQVGRSQRATTASGEGVVVLDDSTKPDRLYASSGYKLSDEMLSAGTIPQIGGARICSIHAKANCLEPVIASITAGRRYRHVLGFEAGEKARAAKDALFNTEQRVGWYPLIDWDWDRNRCREFVAHVTGRTWTKSACSYCVFAMTNRSGQQAVIERYRREPAAAARALLLETVARSLNERQTLIAGTSVAALIARADLAEAQERFEAMLDNCEHAVYEVRRLTRKSSKRPDGRGLTARSVRSTVRGTRPQMHDALRGFPGRRQVGADGIVRHVVRERSCGLPAIEHFYVVCPAVVDDKERAGFDTWWQEATTDAVLF
ncbi:hypothetical protein AFM11_30045 [Mycolicibacterium wolinskyi]|uniref:Phosphoadenosine phosphosulphate reductase domain-containing protein n=1 Tax=Mycolicibacterium wolinskyi TaxID=59750 RepID=A0A132PEL8_9MYCO|nr:hypothetical protein [Mycolicibacterium wolinskyi]KWX20432.1 hypothetical protein AFM11_30045 [Mycolicibacterium wolinskyi]